MRRTSGAALAVALLALLLLVGPAAAPGSTGPAQDGDAPTGGIIPEPDSGQEPEEAGDRGGGLQLALLGLVVVAIVGGGAYVALQSRRAREAREPGYSATSDRMASQADTPSRKPER